MSAALTLVAFRSPPQHVQEMMADYLHHDPVHDIHYVVGRDFAYSPSFVELQLVGSTGIPDRLARIPVEYVLVAMDVVPGEKILGFQAP